MKENDFIRGLPKNIKTEMEGAELEVDSDQVAKENFPGDSPNEKRGRELTKKAFLQGLTQSESIEFDGLLVKKIIKVDDEKKSEDDKDKK